MRKQLTAKAVHYFRKKAPSWILYKVLNTPLLTLFSVHMNWISGALNLVSSTLCFRFACLRYPSSM